MEKKLNSDELFILKKMVEGDIASFKYFFDRYYPELCNFVNIYVHDQVLSEEIVQDIFVYFWEKKEKLQISTSVKSYLFSASKYKSLNTLRDKNSHRIVAEKIGNSNKQRIAEYDDSLIDVDEFKKILDSAVDQLPSRCREVFLLCKKEELSNKEIAQRLGISAKTVENQMTIALKKLRELLAPHKEKIFLLFLIYLFS